MKGARKEVRMRRRWGMESHAKTRRRKEDRDPGICDAVGRVCFWLVIFRLIALRLSVLSDSGREDWFLRGTQRGKRVKKAGNIGLTQRREDAKR